jgi:ribonuclease-3
MLGRRPSTPIEKRLGYRFSRVDLLDLALTHRSRANEEGHEDHYERLEFLGDAVLGLVAADWLYRHLREQPEGELSKRKAVLVSRPSLARFAAVLDLGEALRLGVGEERSGGRSKPSLLADCFEALLGAIYLDGGLQPAAKLAESMLASTVDGSSEKALFADAKSTLQEALQALGWALPEYRLAGVEGPDHERTFTVECWIAGEQAGEGRGGSKKIAEQHAAATALTWLETGPVARPSPLGEADTSGRPERAP